MIINNVYEHFLSIQGEGRFVGKLSTFIRTIGCNACCKFCDSMYANNYDAPSYSLDLSKLNRNVKHVVITGGEPMLPQNNIQDVVKYLISKGHIVTIETNGTIFYDNFIQSDNLYFSISPKLNNSLPSKTSIENYQIQKSLINQVPKSVKQYIEHYKKDNISLKFVVGNDEDMFDVEKLLYDVDLNLSDRNDMVYLMPLGLNQNQLQKTTLKVIDLCKQYCYNYSPRIHIDIWNDKRGV